MQKLFMLSILVAAVACGNSEKTDSDSSGCGCGEAPVTKTDDGCGGAGGVPAKTDGCGCGDAPADAGKEIVLNVSGMT